MPVRYQLLVCVVVSLWLLLKATKVDHLTFEFVGPLVPTIRTREN